MIKKFKVLNGFFMFIDKPMVRKGCIIEINTNETHTSWIAYWIAMGYIKEAVNE